MLIVVNTKKVIETLRSMERIDKKMIWEYGIENKLKFKQQRFDMWVSKVKSFFVPSSLQSRLQQPYLRGG